MIMTMECLENYFFTNVHNESKIFVMCKIQGKIIDDGMSESHLYYYDKSAVYDTMLCGSCQVILIHACSYCLGERLNQYIITL